MNLVRTRKLEYLEENVRALKVRLTPEENADIRESVDNAEVHGDRYPDVLAFGLFADSPLP